jgi:hypothetical protein
VSFSIWDAERLRSIEYKQRQELEALKEIIRKQDRQIALLEGILRALESRIDDGR